MKSEVKNQKSENSISGKAKTRTAYISCAIRKNIKQLEHLNRIN